MFILYDLVFLIVTIIYLPVYLFRRKFHRGFWQRLGFIRWQANPERPIWIHAVSVGEAASIRGLVSGLRKNYPQKRLIISTVTATGNKIAQGLAGKGDLVTYLPLDFSFIVRGVIDKINPELFVIAETEIWPNLISYIEYKKIPVAIVNGRISDASYKGYMLARFILKSILRKVSLFCVQTQLDAQRLLALGVDKERVVVTGNMKFDNVLSLPDKEDSCALKEKLGLADDEKILVAGSTHPEEEEPVLAAYKKLLDEDVKLRLILAPRHPERAQEIVNLTRKFDLDPATISSLKFPAREHMSSSTVFILDTIGQLIDYYAIADIVFVGGSLVKTGGHNILEPASLNKPVLFGPYMFNFRDIAELFLKNQAAIKVQDGNGLEAAIKSLLGDPRQAQGLGSRARELLAKNQGAVKRNLDRLADILRKKSK